MIILNVNGEELQADIEADTPIVWALRDTFGMTGTMFGCGLAQVYGLTETTGAITYLGPEPHNEGDEKRLKSCGHAMTGIELRVVPAHRWF